MECTQGAEKLLRGWNDCGGFTSPWIPYYATVHC